LSDALLFAHTRLNSNTARTLETSSFLYALIELLSEKGLLTIDELDARKDAVADRLKEQYRSRGMGVVTQDPESDKYSFQTTVELDCPSKIPFCRASCCRLPFALSRQDISERVVQWDFSRPYMIAQGDSNYCTHIDRGSSCCTIREQRPLPCRAYDCRNDKRIWIDFENNIVNPEILRETWPDPIEEGPGETG